MTTRNTWKQSERRMATILGGERVPVTGRERGHAPDIEGVTWAGRRVAIEHKYGKRILSARLGTAIDQAKAACRASSDIPLVTIEETGLTRTMNLRLALLDVGLLVDIIEHYEQRIRTLEARAPVAPGAVCLRCGGSVVVNEALCLSCGRAA
mgnify:FL=1